MLGYDAYLWLMALPLALGGIYFLTCETPIGTAILFEGGSIGMHVDCCCCPRCALGCTRTPRLWGTVEFTGIVGHDIAGSPPPLYECTDPETETEDYCRYGNGGSGSPNGLNDTTFEVECLQAAACEYNGSTGSGQFCGFDSIDINLYGLWDSDRGVFIRLRDNESPSWYAWASFFEDVSHPIDCHAVQTPSLVDESDNTCDFSSATVTFTPYCAEP